MKRFLKSLGYALTGIRQTFKSERNFRTHLAIMLIAIALGLYVRLTVLSWGIVILAIGFVLVAELFNTAIERLGDEAANGSHKLTIKHAKDVAAGAVVISAVTALAVGILFILVPLIQKLSVIMGS
jgi:diacylglycerol kinase